MANNFVNFGKPPRVPLSSAEQALNFGRPPLSLAMWVDAALKEADVDQNDVAEGRFSWPTSPQSSSSSSPSTPSSIGSVPHFDPSRPPPAFFALIRPSEATRGLRWSEAGELGVRPVGFEGFGNLLPAPFDPSIPPPSMAHSATKSSSFSLTDASTSPASFGPSMQSPSADLLPTDLLETAFDPTISPPNLSSSFVSSSSSEGLPSLTDLDVSSQEQQLPELYRKCVDCLEAIMDASEVRN